MESVSWNAPGTSVGNLGFSVWKAGSGTSALAPDSREMSGTMSKATPIVLKILSWSLGGNESSPGTIGGGPPLALFFPFLDFFLRFGDFSLPPDFSSASSSSTASGRRISCSTSGRQTSYVRDAERQ
jgi:hypothetical protein